MASAASAPAQAVDEVEFARLYHAHVDRARRVAWRLLSGDEAAAEDVVQEAFVKAFRNMGRFRGDARFETWLYRIVVNQAHNHRRWRTVRQAFSGLLRGDEADPRPEPVGDPGLRRRIAEALDQLSAGQREAFVLVHMEGFTVVETAELLKRSPGTVKTHLHRALKALRAELGDLRKEDA